jgi:hypothetical protein
MSSCPALNAYKQAQRSIEIALLGQIFEKFDLSVKW